MAFRELEESIRRILRRLGGLETTKADKTALATKANVSHTHTASQVTDFAAQAQSAVRGASWHPHAVAGGTVTFTGTGAKTADATVTFPAGRFSVPPIITTSQTASGGNTFFLARVVSKSATGVTFRIAVSTDSFTGAYSVDWMAVQMTSTAATG
ncbi:hypothetical protein [Microbacterium oleivorans]|uniref:H-type lectin domain-containing protein n=1 Tax=Microbacterium oleivorans TaxID=273677 RepID=A0A4R5YGX2_9MICO|nr:hypothetical protein [Microbacterium oleivorans]TDL43608.1 hypothetical protein E2R54_10365 [Microbacterium oleivorans]